MAKIKVSVITVVFNGVRSVETAIKSVLSQSYQNIEYVIVDGGSTDGTVDVLKKYKKGKSVSKGIDLFVSEKDKGIYDAMNKGVKLCKGEVVYFLNADDKFYNKDVVKEVAELFTKDKVDLVYGDVLFEYPAERKKVRVTREFSLAELRKGTMPPHQGTFAKRQLLLSNPFDLSYRSSADFDWFCRMAKKGIKFSKIDKIVAVFTSGGVSSGKVSYKETELAVKKYFGVGVYSKLVMKHRVFSGIKFVLVKTHLIKHWHGVNSRTRIV